ncbi:MAG: repeat containing protein [Herbinix sp.]|jgi:glucose/arabinose dehydrogenase|nr:repeat containing protein [Herbinix sp.]
MYHKTFGYSKLVACVQSQVDATRYVNPSDFNLSSEYNIEVFAQGLDSPIGFVFSNNGDLYIIESGFTSRNPKLLRLTPDRFEVISEDFITPVRGINYMDGNIYVSHGDRITIIRADGTRQDILSGLLCNGDYGISNVAFGPDGKIYFGQGTVTNSGVVGLDNEWVSSHPFLHDEPTFDIILNGQNFITNNMFIKSRESTYTGAFSSYGIPNLMNEIKKGIIRGSGSVLRANRDGTDLELISGGFRNPIHVRFDREYRLFVVNRGYDVRGSRPIANAPDELHILEPGVWYGWPDYVAGEPVTSPRFKPEGSPQPEFLIANHPNIPPKPYAEFQPHSSIMGFDFDYTNYFGSYGDIYMSEYGSHGPLTLGRSTPYYGIGHKVSRINRGTGDISTFVGNKSGLPANITGEGGFGRPVDVKFGPDRSLYILDIGLSNPNNLAQLIPYTGLIWRISKA